MLKQENCLFPRFSIYCIHNSINKRTFYYDKIGGTKITGRRA